MTKADKIIEKQRLLQKELEKIQKNCKHENKIIKFDQEQSRYMWTCTECQNRVGFPSPDDIEKFLK